MTPSQHAEAARLALIAVVAATGLSATGSRLCRAMMDIAAERLRCASGESITARQADATGLRMAGAAVLDSVCAACAACPRGVSDDPVMVEPQAQPRAA